MGHLNEVHAKYADKGLRIFAISPQDRSAVAKYVEELGVEFPTVSGAIDVMDLYDCQSFPSSFLIDTSGRIVWEGHPSGLNDGLLEQHLEGAKILPDWPDDLKDARREFEKSDYADALAKTLKHLEKDDLEAEIRSAAERIRDWLRWYGTARLEAARADIVDGRYYEASVALEEIQGLYKGHELEDEADTALDELLADKDRKLEVKAGEKLAKILEKTRGESEKDVLKALKPLLSRKYEETRAGKKAKSMAEELEKKL